MEEVMEKILIIDDDEMDLQLMNLVFTREGYDVVKTADGPQGIDLFRQLRPAFVFLDLGLPSVNGMDVLKEIRSLDKDSRVVVITGYGSERLASDAISYGALGFIEKSWDVAKMMTNIRTIISAFGQANLQ